MKIWSKNNSSEDILGGYHVLNAFYGLTHLILTATLWDRCDYYLYLAGEETKAKRELKKII